MVGCHLAKGKIVTQATVNLFAQTAGPTLKESPGHVPDILIKGSSVRVVCSCGERLGGGRGCNRAGMDYAIYYAKLAYMDHVAEDE